MGKEQENSKMLKVLDWAYEKSLDGIPKMGSAIELAESYMDRDETLTEKSNSLIRWQISKTATAGFLTGLGGLITLPVAIPANIASVIYVQMRMIAAIAHMGGYDIKDDKVKSLVYVCLAGNEAKDILKNVGIQLGTKLTKSMIEKYVTREVLKKINQAVGFRMVTKFGTTGIINLGKAIPLVGGIIGGSFDAITTNTIGNVARDTFITKENDSMVIDATIVEDESTKVIINAEFQKFYSFLNLIKIDGKIANEELNLIEEYIDNSGLDDNLKMELIGKLSNSDLIPVDYSLFKNSPEKSINLINQLVALAKIDNEVHPSERMFIRNVAKQLDIPGEDVNELLND